MKLKEGFLTHDSDNQQVLIAAGKAADCFHGVARSNKTAAFIVNCLKEEVTEQDIVNAMLEQYDAPKEVIAGDVRRILDVLREIGAIDEA